MPKRKRLNSSTPAASTNPFIHLTHALLRFKIARRIGSGARDSQPLPTPLEIAAAMCQLCNASSGFGYTRRQVAQDVEFVRFLPQRFRLIEDSAFFLENRKTADRVGQLQRRSLFAAVDRERIS
jgi:hypothetical protein